MKTHFEIPISELKEGHELINVGTVIKSTKCFDFYSVIAVCPVGKSEVWLHYKRAATVLIAISTAGAKQLSDIANPALAQQRQFPMP